MTSKHLIAAVLVVAGLAAAYAFLTEPEPQKEPGSSWSIPELGNFDRFDLRRGDLDLVIDKGGEGWRIREPIQFGAASDQMDRIEGLFADAERRVLVDDEKEASPNNLTRYGFDDDTLHVTVYDGGEAAATFTVGGTQTSEAGQARTWVRPDGGDTLYRLNRDLRTILDKELADWRDSQVIELSNDERDAITAIDVSYGDHQLRFEKATDDEGEDEWSIVEPADLVIDPDLVSRWVRQVSRLSAADFGDDVSAAEAGLDEPEQVVTLHLGDDETYRLEFGRTFVNIPEPEASADEGIDEGTGAGVEEETPEQAEGEEQRYVRLGDGPIFSVSLRDAERFMKRVGDFRPRDILSVERDAITAIEITDADGSVMLLARNDPAEDADEGTEVTWQMTRPEQIDSVNMGEMRRVLSNVADIEAERFPEGTDAAAAGLAEPRRVLVITLDDDSQHRIVIGGPTEPGTEGQDDTGQDRYVQVDDGLVFELRGFKVRNLLKNADDLRPEDEDEG